MNHIVNQFLFHVGWPIRLLGWVLAHYVAFFESGRFLCKILLAESCRPRRCWNRLKEVRSSYRKTFHEVTGASPQIWIMVYTLLAVLIFLLVTEK